MKKKSLLILLIIILIAIGYAYFVGIIDFTKPKVIFKEKPQFVGANKHIEFKVEDNNPGIKSVEVFVIQNEKNIKIFEDKNVPEGIKEKDYSLDIKARQLRLREGKAKILIIAQDGSLLKNKTTLEIPVKVDLTPPTLSILSSPATIINGGTGFVFYRTSKDIEKTGVKVGDLDFKCFNGIFKNPNIYGCAFPYPYYWNTKKPIIVYAIDKAGNSSQNSLMYFFKKVRYKRSIVNITDTFIETKVRPLSDKDIQDPIELFKYVNVEVRKRNEDKIHQITSDVKIIKPMFHGRFLQLKNSKRLGGFADYRKYRYKGKIIKGADAYHKGMDLASIKNAPVQAANDGIVRFVGFLGIYGNSIIIEHGMGIFTLYSHLAESKVKVGDTVVKGQEIGITDTTGLAVGDHLHFGVLVQGLEVHPIEWFDRRWIKTRFENEYNKIKKLYGGEK
ncbi:M23 family metallopeptidase [Hydrogenothermus marinus]|uniref:Peptidase M23-like protein n=1 Tax=Hydrogenothermus marinus TaxID=133270 RepID=A0A3M0BIZ2_9AQUI|nr:M23 family metallopeptidase [Hydrogenothermus marinus]RMA97161.1 peptidase M23-like protein [Hydrogenothermus marinus]